MGWKCRLLLSVMGTLLSSPCSADGAIALSDCVGAPDYIRYGYSYDAFSAREAASVALRRCPDCKTIYSYHGVCFALATDRCVWGTGYADSAGEAREIALQACHQRENGACAIAFSVCDHELIVEPPGNEDTRRSVVNPCMTYGGHRVPNCH